MKRLHTERPCYGILALCVQFGVSKQAFYKHGSDAIERAVRDRFIIEYVRSVRKLNSGIGGEKLWYMYKTFFGTRYSTGRDAFASVLRRHDLTLRGPRKGCRTTDSTHGLPLYPNLITNLEIEHPNRVWVSDITYIRLPEGFCFLSLLTDAYDHTIVGYKVAPTLEAIHSLEALKQACTGLKQEQAGTLIHHSDRGVQYASIAYTDELKRLGIRISMTENGDPKENAIAERVNGILKEEFLNQQNFTDIEQVCMAVASAVAFYNTLRPHRSLDMLTPQQARKGSGALKKRWKSYADKYKMTPADKAASLLSSALPPGKPGERAEERSASFVQGAIP